MNFKKSDISFQSRQNIIKIVLVSVLFLFCIFGFNVAASNEEIYVFVGGDAIGLDLQTGVYITGKFNTTVKNDLITGDLLTTIDGVDVDTIDDLKMIINSKEQGDKVTVEFIRNGIQMRDSVVIGTKEGRNTLGVYVKDNVLGVGTLTFVTSDLKFGSLGHSASSDLVEISSGNIMECYISGIKKGLRGVPGEKKAILNKKIIGKVKMNNDFGVFGKLDKFDENREKVELAEINEAKLGKAYIRTVLDGNKIEEFEIEIVELEKQNSKKTKGIKYKVTDEKLISQAGGIIQGMSGSPILQNGKLIGAVSHVIINDPLTGYGVYGQWMIEHI